MGTDYFQDWDDVDYYERLSFLADEFEYLKQMASQYSDSDKLDWDED